MARGRKSGAVLWRPDVVTEEGPIFVPRLQQQPIGRVLRFISGLPDPNDSGNKIQVVSDYYLRWAMADVVRRRWLPTMRFDTSEKKNKFSAAERRFIEGEGLVLSRLLDIAAEAHLINGCNYSHYAYWWLDCCCEVSTHRMSFLHLGAENPTKKDACSQYEGHTAKLRSRSINPFSAGPSSRMFDIAIALAQGGTNKKKDSEHFYSKKYIPYLEARASLAQIARKKGADIMSKNYFESI